MINWLETPIGHEMGLILIEENDTRHSLVIVLKEYEWAPNREPYIANLEIVAADSKTLHVGNIIKLPLLTHEKEGFLVFAPYSGHPNHQIKMNAKLKFHHLVEP
jgi:hypothetical protein